jgi:hypothetical protein
MSQNNCLQSVSRPRVPNVLQEPLCASPHCRSSKWKRRLLHCDRLVTWSAEEIYVHLRVNCLPKINKYIHKRKRYKYCRVFPRQRDKKIYVCFGFGRIFIGRSLFTPTNTIIRTYNVLGRFPFNVIHSRTANRGEVSCPLLGAQLYLDLVEYELYWYLVGSELLYPALGQNRNTLSKGLVSLAAMHRISCCRGNKFRYK